MNTCGIGVNATDKEPETVLPFTVTEAVTVMLVPSSPAGTAISALVVSALGAIVTVVSEAVQVNVEPEGSVIGEPLSSRTAAKVPDVPA